MGSRRNSLMEETEKTIITYIEMCGTFNTLAPLLCTKRTHRHTRGSDFVMNSVHCVLMHNATVFSTMVMSRADLVVSKSTFVCFSHPFCTPPHYIHPNWDICFQLLWNARMDFCLLPQGSRGVLFSRSGVKLKHTNKTTRVAQFKYFPKSHVRHRAGVMPQLYT